MEYQYAVSAGIILCVSLVIAGMILLAIAKAQKSDTENHALQEAQKANNCKARKLLVAESRHNRIMGILHIIKHTDDLPDNLAYVLIKTHVHDYSDANDNFAVSKALHYFKKTGKLPPSYYN